MKLQLTHLTLTSLSFLTRSLSIIGGKPNKFSLSLSLTVFQTLKQKAKNTFWSLHFQSISVLVPKFFFLPLLVPLLKNGSILVPTVIS